MEATEADTERREKGLAGAGHAEPVVQVRSLVWEHWEGFSSRGTTQTDFQL